LETHPRNIIPEFRVDHSAQSAPFLSSQRKATSSYVCQREDPTYIIDFINIKTILCSSEACKRWRSSERRTRCANLPSSLSSPSGSSITLSDRYLFRNNDKIIAAFLTPPPRKTVRNVQDKRDFVVFTSERRTLSFKFLYFIFILYIMNDFTRILPCFLASNRLKAPFSFPSQIPFSTPLAFLSSPPIYKYEIIHHLEKEFVDYAKKELKDVDKVVRVICSSKIGFAPLLCLFLSSP